VISGSHAYIASHLGNRIQILDISNLSAPVAVGFFSVPGISAITIDGKYIYAACDLAGLRTIDISNPTSPVIVGTRDTAGHAQSVAQSGPYAYVADYQDGVDVFAVPCGTTGILPDGGALSPILGPNVPNPFSGNQMVKIPFTLGQAGVVTLQITDVSGRHVRTLMDSWTREGKNEVLWDGRDDLGVEVSAGIYLYVLHAAGTQATGHMVKLR
jgi:hypothetical protein